MPEIANDICLLLGCSLHWTVGRHDLVTFGIGFVMVYNSSSLSGIFWICFSNKWLKWLSIYNGSGWKLLLIASWFFHKVVWAIKWAKPAKTRQPQAMDLLEDRPGLSFKPVRSAGLETCITSVHHKPVTQKFLRSDLNVRFRLQSNTVSFAVLPFHANLTTSLCLDGLTTDIPKMKKKTITSSHVLDCTRYAACR